MLPDKKYLACNYAESTKVAQEGALCYVTSTDNGSGMERVEVVARSKGGRWIKKWENTKRLKDFRLKTIPAEHARYNDERIYAFYEQKNADDLNAVANRLREKQSGN